MPTAAQITSHDAPPPPPGVSPWVAGAAPETDVEVVEYDAAWPAAYASVAARITTALGWRALHVEHVGSTAVPGLPAKPVLDVDLVVADPADEGSYVPALTAAGFVLRVREPWWWEHRMLRHDSPRTNLHVFGPDAPEPVRHRLFRDWLRAHPDEIATYRDAKLEAASAANAVGEHVMEYNARKQATIRAVYDRAFRATGLLPT